MSLPRSPLIKISDYDYPNYIKSALRAGDFNERNYQKYAVSKAMEVLRSGQNAEIVLPPGTGKTLIAQIIACRWRHEEPTCRSRILFLLPTRVLREQHCTTCDRWARDLCLPLEVSGEWLNDRRPWHADEVRKRYVYFALPRSLHGGLQKGKFPADCWSKIGLVVIDEYDAFSVGILTAEGVRERVSKNLSILVSDLKSRTRGFLLMSATPLALSSQAHRLLP
jgi:ERCC4-related helicase